MHTNEFHPELSFQVFQQPSFYLFSQEIHLSSKNIIEDLRKLNVTDADYIHVDVMDGKFVKGKTLSFKELREIHRYTSKTLDVHLMVKKPLKYIDDYATLNTEYITIHVENKYVDKSLRRQCIYVSIYCSRSTMGR